MAHLPKTLAVDFQHFSWILQESVERIDNVTYFMVCNSFGHVPGFLLK